MQAQHTYEVVKVVDTRYEPNKPFDDAESIWEDTGSLIEDVLQVVSSCLKSHRTVLRGLMQKVLRENYCQPSMRMQEVYYCGASILYIHTCV
jgi:hypothetical protein